MIPKGKLKRKAGIAILSILIIAAGAIISLISNSRGIPVNGVGKPCTFVIDPGHGGIDSGALSKDGKKESDINLAIALKLDALAGFYGESTVLTRCDDSWRTDADSYSEREDLIHRTSIINAAENGVLISIHQNCYPTGQPSGVQVLYASDEESERLGKLTHQNLVNCLEDKSRRLAEPASPKLYITSNVNCPAILVECGFMSNFSDVLKLTDPMYQLKIAGALMGSYLQYTNNLIKT